jgi:hypothetical protein
MRVSIGGQGAFEGDGALFDSAHEPEQIAAVDLLDVSGGVALFEQGPG